MRGEVNQHCCSPLRLLNALLIERDIRLTLKTALGVPGSPTVAPEDDSAFPAGIRSIALFAHALPLRGLPVVTDSGSSNSGQSFQSLSIA